MTDIVVNLIDNYGTWTGQILQDIFHKTYLDVFYDESNNCLRIFKEQSSKSEFLEELKKTQRTATFNPQTKEFKISPKFVRLTVDGKYLEGFDSYFGHMLLVTKKEDAKVYDIEIANKICERHPALKQENIDATPLQNDC